MIKRNGFIPNNNNNNSNHAISAITLWAQNEVTEILILLGAFS
jgi:hypothetical protein